MSHRAEELIRTLGLVPHPEGGRFREAFRSEHIVVAERGAKRPALTAIYFLLAAGEKSRWHRVTHDEVWHFHEGDPLELLVLTPDLARLEHLRLGRADGVAAPIATVPAGSWQAARPTGAYSLCGCAVGPGFEYEDFALMAAHAEIASRLRAAFPDLADLL